MKNSVKPVINSKNFFKLFVFAILVSHINIYSQTTENYKSKLHIEGASNIGGNTISVGYDYFFSKHFYAGVSLGEGYYQYNYNDNDPYLVFIGNTVKDHIISYDFKNLIDLKAGYRFKVHKGLNFANLFDAGVSYMHVIYNKQFVDGDNLLWKGEKSYSQYWLFSSLSILDYIPEEQNHLSFSLGCKIRLTMTKSPQTLVVENSRGENLIITKSISGGNRMFWLFPELYLRINYSL